MAAKKGTANGGAEATATLDKESMRQIVLQVSGFLKIFGASYPRLRLIAALLDVQAQPEVWDTIWAAFSSSEEVQEIYSQISSEVQSMGQQVHGVSDTANKLLAFGTGKAAVERDANYYKVRSLVFGILMMAQGLTYITRTTADDEAARITIEIATLYFDQYYDTTKPRV